jgi:hypothetical protein
VSVGKLKEMQNGGKKTRRGIDAWDRVSRSRSRMSAPSELC